MAGIIKDKKSRAKMPGLLMDHYQNDTPSLTWP